VRRLPFFLAVLALCTAALADDPSADAILLVARSDLPDPFFHDSVVLVTNAVVAPFGVIVNKPLKFKLSEAMPDVERMKKLDEKIFFGGPVQADDVLFVFRAAEAPQSALRIMEGVYMSGNRELLDSLLARDKPMEGLRVLAGHAGWSPGQLENEISRGDWALLPADAATIFSAKPDAIWAELSRRAAATKVRYILSSSSRNPAASPCD
jgi:putative transcriptional regulator